jgi:hypothetical protein
MHVSWIAREDSWLLPNPIMIYQTKKGLSQLSFSNYLGCQSHAHCLLPQVHKSQELYQIFIKMCAAKCSLNLTFSTEFILERSSRNLTFKPSKKLYNLIRKLCLRKASQSLERPSSSITSRLFQKFIRTYLSRSSVASLRSLLDRQNKLLLLWCLKTEFMQSLIKKRV